MAVGTVSRTTNQCQGYPEAKKVRSGIGIDIGKKFIAVTMHARRVSCTDLNQYLSIGSGFQLKTNEAIGVRTPRNGL